MKINIMVKTGLTRLALIKNELKTFLCTEMPEAELSNASG